MRFYQLIFKSLWHYRRRNLTVALGMAIGMAVITGALVTGDSVHSGLQNLVGIRLGNIDLSVSSGDQYITDSLAYRMSAGLGIPATPVLQLEGSATAGGGASRLPKIQIFGVENTFCELLGPETFNLPVNDNEVVISDNLASRLNVQQGDEILLRINKPGLIPIDAPFVSDAENIITTRVTVHTIAGKNLHGRFHLRNTQSAPYNIFIHKEDLQKLAGLQGLSNLILLAGDGKISAGQAEKVLASSRTLRDASLVLEKHPSTGEWILRTPRVFFTSTALTAIGSLPLAKSFWFSYFVNEFRAGNHTTPYSFVSTLPGNQVPPGEIVINQWLSDDLKARTGDSVTLSYFMVGPLRNLSVKQARFRISGIIPMNDPHSDRLLMPEIPGLSDAGNCRDWETSVPVNLAAIRDKDEQYWNQYRGTPKAYINAGQAAVMWENRFGKYTQIRFSPESNPVNIARGILSRLRPADTGISIREPAREGLAAASSGTDFSGLFLGLSCFLIAGGIILTILLIRLGLEGRLPQTGTLRAVGWPEHKIRQLLLREIFLVAIIGTLIGLAVTVIYTRLIFYALNGVWNDIVLTDTLHPVFKPMTLIFGMAVNILVSIGSAWLALSRFFRRKPVELLHLTHTGHSVSSKRLLLIVSGIAGIGALGMMGFGLIRVQSISPAFFFVAGTLMLTSLLLAATCIIRYHTSSNSRPFTFGSLSHSNLYRNPGRSLSVILLFAIGIFMVIAIGANRKTESTLPQGGTGGFLFFMETTVPVPDNLNSPEIRAKYGLDTPSGFVQMKRLEGDDASCLNLNRVSNPPLLGIPDGAFTGRFRFVSMQNNEFTADPWKMLQQKMPDHVIPAVADQTVIQWGLGLKLGDTLKYKSETGDVVKIVLTGGLANSVFQGSILIPEELFIRYWPSVSGTTVSLIAADLSNIEPVQTEIMRVFRDYGTDLKPAAVKLAVFNAIENTYLSIFLMMGALAMLLGTIGLAIILARNLQERRSEIAILCATGFSRYRILWLVTREYATLLLFATLAGGISSLVCVLPGVLNPSGAVSWLSLLTILLMLLANGVLWIVLLGWNAVRQQGIIQSLRTE